ncbi:hypothetical protein GQ55_3G315700 [Panicum hallii var. hallii]|uniref:Uncharacterized protein n=1 Tax=Panicum hallii var. hallii TaxID=1504633 RepID=A0A2T7EFA4_9POAL|nr:hypothetical protein GQ55_3G315700 [Panicum hallii var. hallii]
MAGARRSCPADTSGAQARPHFSSRPCRPPRPLAGGHTPVTARRRRPRPRNIDDKGKRKGSLGPMEESAAILEHLKIIEVRCDAVDERIFKLALFQCAFHIRLSFYLLSLMDHAHFPGDLDQIIVLIIL